jgi:hypothetical protein
MEDGLKVRGVALYEFSRPPRIQNFVRNFQPREKGLVETEVSLQPHRR